MKILAADSITTTPAELLALTDATPFKLISIDGGHTAEHTLSDLHLASAVIHRFGFVFVDDILNASWLGVIDGVTEFLRQRPKLWPLAIGYNKLVMCPMSVHPTYKRQFEQNYEFLKTTRLCGYDVLVSSEDGSI